MTDSGEFVIVWHSSFQDGNDAGVFGQMYNADGTPDGREFQLHTSTAESQFYPSVTTDNSGAIITAWTDRGWPGAVSSLVARRWAGFRDEVYLVTVDSAAMLRSLDFGNYQPAGLSGQVFEDTDASGQRGPDETGLDGWIVELLDAGTGAVVGTQVTAGVDLNDDGQIDPESEAGLYAFDGLIAGNYQIRQVLPGGWDQTTPASPAYEINL